MEESQNSKSRSHNSFTIPFDLILHFLEVSFVITLRAKFKVSSLNRSGDIERRPKILESRSCDPFLSPI